ncbi:sigma-70 family RNA polymerase sigma factor [Herbiconiux flava]|uniref:RNA polymerase sigma-B factor n=1 Tax=Herbiconiux flava TaxID=881268 RepID=A0A852SS79_9MICO|nr:sigma-70 family RNA polymerase sigma factor [Herbiconiux flava]NYD71756.1 RNA polymerase sigma-B factor [Herbiconiux flava]GLK18280.1 RNA polymerase sigma factor [Herbiconiux flava]
MTRLRLSPAPASPTLDAPTLDAPAVEQLVLGHLALAQAVARRYFRPSAGANQNEDLLQVAYVGLVKAAQRFDPERGENFASFAVPTVAGEIKRHLRDNGWIIRPPRRIQELHGRVREAVPRLTQRLGRAPGPAELAQELDCGVDEVLEALASSTTLFPASLDRAVGDDEGVRLSDVIPSAGDEIGHAETAATIAYACRELPEQQRRIIYLRFFEDLTQQEIASELGVTQMQVSRLLARALDGLRQRIARGPSVRWRAAGRASAHLARTRLVA